MKFVNYDNLLYNTKKNPFLLLWNKIYFIYIPSLGSTVIAILLNPLINENILTFADHLFDGNVCLGTTEETMFTDLRATGDFDAYKGVVQATPAPGNEPALSQWLWLFRTTMSWPPPWFNHRAYRTQPRIPAAEQMASETGWHSAPAANVGQDVARNSVLWWIPTDLAFADHVAQSRTVDVSIIGHRPKVPRTDDVLFLRRWLIPVGKKYHFRIFPLSGELNAIVHLSCSHPVLLSSAQVTRNCVLTMIVIVINNYLVLTEVWRVYIYINVFFTIVRTHLSPRLMINNIIFLYLYIIM